MEVSFPPRFLSVGVVRFFPIASYRVFCCECEIRRFSYSFSLLFYFIVVGLSVPKVTTHCGTDNAGFTVRCGSYGPLFGLGVMAVLFRGQIMYILSMFSNQLPDAEDSKLCGCVLFCAYVCVLFVFICLCMYVCLSQELYAYDLCWHRFYGLRYVLRGIIH